VARQRLGQHFLNNPSILERIAKAACPEPCPLVIEIGPGRGALTSRLLARAGHVIAIEIDPFLANRLRAQHQGLQVVEADVLTTDLGQWGPAVVTGNLPYYITSPILSKLAEAPFQRAVFLIQKEVAERLTASPGSRDYGYLTVQTALFASVRRLFDVKPGSFVPPPKVDSTVVLLERRPPMVEEPARFLEFASRCFQHKRKTLRNNLAPFYGAAIVGSWPEAGQRAEQLSVGQLIDLYRRTL
jgi:16S rRNA (adenine1518-N6/adenine1519-N6)-dimethyltransferase